MGGWPHSLGDHQLAIPVFITCPARGDPNPGAAEASNGATVTEDAESRTGGRHRRRRALAAFQKTKGKDPCRPAFQQTTFRSQTFKSATLVHGASSNMFAVKDGVYLNLMFAHSVLAWCLTPWSMMLERKKHGNTCRIRLWRIYALNMSAPCVKKMCVEKPLPMDRLRPHR